MTADPEEPIPFQARLIGGPNDGADRKMKAGQWGYLGAFPGYGGIYWPTWERQGDKLIYRWQENPEPQTPPWLRGRFPNWPRIGRDASGGIYYLPPKAE